MAVERLKSPDPLLYTFHKRGGQRIGEQDGACYPRTVDRH